MVKMLHMCALATITSCCILPCKFIICSAADPTYALVSFYLGICDLHIASVVAHMLATCSTAACLPHNIFCQVVLGLQVMQDAVKRLFRSVNKAERAAKSNWSMKLSSDLPWPCVTIIIKEKKAKGCSVAVLFCR